VTDQLVHPQSRLRRHGRQTSDAQLAAALRRGDERAFEAVYDRYHAALFGFCRHMLGSREEAEDALQHVFVAAHRRLRDAPAPAHLRAWLYAIARNRCVSMLRARRDAVSLDDAQAPGTDGLVVSGEVERREELEELLGDLTRLPEDQRAALVLAEIGDLDHAEIAIALGVRREKVKALIFQAREALGGWRQAREASCRDIREQLATLRGSALRRAPLRRHVELCPTCAAFEREVARQRSALALLVPVAPGLALKHSVLAATLGEAAGAGAGAIGAGAGLSAKALVVTALALSAGGAGTVAVRQLDPPAAPARAAAVAAPRPAPVAARAVAQPVAAPVIRGSRPVPAPTRATATHGRGNAAAEQLVKTRGRSAQAPGHSASHASHGRASWPAGQHDRGQHGRPAVPPGQARKAASPAAPKPHPVAQAHPAPAARTHVPPGQVRKAPAPATPVAPAKGNSPQAPGHTKG
jgi:RNA polymerase sigma factor (sigma-70 family)